MNYVNKLCKQKSRGFLLLEGLFLFGYLPSFADKGTLSYLRVEKKGILL